MLNCCICGRFIARKDLWSAVPYGSYDDVEEPEAIYAHEACLSGREKRGRYWRPWVRVCDAMTIVEEVADG